MEVKLSWNYYITAPPINGKTKRGSIHEDTDFVSMKACTH